MCNQHEQIWYIVLKLIVSTAWSNHIDCKWFSTSYSRPSSGQVTLSTIPTAIALARRSVTCPELLLDVLELDTFYDSNCRAGSDDFNASKIIEKYEGLTQQLRWGILTVLAARSPSCHHLPPPGSTYARWLPHILWEAWL